MGNGNIEQRRVVYIVVALVATIVLEMMLLVRRNISKQMDASQER